MGNATVKKLVGITIPLTWVKAIDKRTTETKNRQDIIIELMEPKITEWIKEANQ